MTIGTDAEKKNKGGAEDIRWHPAFFVALQATLIDYKNVLEYKSEHQLNTEPLRIDVLVIRKRPDVVIQRQIAEIFRQDNIFEYKSPTDYLSVNEFHRAFARANLYKALENVDIAGLTLSFVVETHPRELFRHLRETLGYNVEKRHPGIFVVTGAMMPIQIIESKALSDDENIWLRNLTRELSEPEQDLKWLKLLKEKYGSRLDLSAYLYAVVVANRQRLSKGENDMWSAEMCKTFEELGWTDKWIETGRKQGREQGREEGRLEGRLEGRDKWREESKLEDAKAMFAEGDSIEKIARVTKLPIEMLKEKLAVP